MLTEMPTLPRIFAANSAGGARQTSVQLRIAEGLSDWTSVKSVLLVRLRSIGDTVLMTACLHALKTWRPDIRISVAMEPLSAPILEQHPFVDDLIVVGRSATARLRLIRALRRSHYDLAFNMHGGGTASIITSLSGSKMTVGYDGLSQSWMLKARAPAPDAILGRTEIHSVEQQLALLGWSGMPLPQKPTLRLAVSDGARDRMQNAVSALLARSPGDGFALIAPGAAFESKQWPAVSFAAVARHLKDRWGLPSIVIAGPGQERIAQQVKADAGPHAHLLTSISLKELIALSRMARIFVGNDSGPMHISAALNRPIVATFGSSDPSVWRPWTEAPFRIIKSSEIARISIAEVTGALDELLTEPRGVTE